MKNLIFISLLLTFTTCSNNTTEQIADGNPDPTLNKIQNEFLNNQSLAILTHVNKILDQHLPDWPEPEQRKAALLLLDGVLHDVYAPQRPPVQEFFHKRMEKATIEIEQTKVEEGARIWKLYNHGFVVRTPSVTIAFDLIRGESVRVKDFALDNNLMKRIIDQCDALFISHYHRDHAEKWVAQAFIDQEKPVVARPDIWKDQQIHSSLTHLKREAHTLQSLSIQGSKLNLDVVIYPGHQGSNIDCNVALVITPEGLSFSQTGDQSNNEDFEWIDEVANHHDVDVFFPNCWTTDIVRAIKGFDPAIETGTYNKIVSLFNLVN